MRIGKVKKPRKLPMVLEKEDVDKMLAIPNIKCPTGLRNRAMLEVMVGAGLRVSEVVNLRRSDIVWAKGMIEVKDGKGGKDRNIPITSETLAWLQAWDEKRPSGARKFFCTLKGKPVAVRYVQAAVRRIAVKAGIEKAERVSPHTLRHTYATLMLDKGMSIVDVQHLLGHASVATTQVYLHVRPKELARKIQKDQFVTNAAPMPPQQEASINELLKAWMALPESTQRSFVKALNAMLPPLGRK